MSEPQIQNVVKVPEGLNRCQLYQRADEERTVHSHFVAQQHVRASFATSWCVQGQSYGMSRNADIMRSTADV